MVRRTCIPHEHQSSRYSGTPCKLLQDVPPARKEQHQESARQVRPTIRLMTPVVLAISRTEPLPAVLLEIRQHHRGTDGGGDCSACHSSDFAAEPHKVVGHAVMVSNLASCQGCHTGTAGTEPDIPVTTADHKVHDSCAACHLFPMDAWQKRIRKRRRHSAEPMVAEAAQHVINGFPGHSHHNLMNDVTYDPAGGDTAYPAQQGCADCRQDYTGTSPSLNTWTGILYEHDMDGVKDGNSITRLS